MSQYLGNNQAKADAAAAIDAAAQSWDDLDAGAFFETVDDNADVTVSQASMDVPSGTLAATGISFNPATETIVRAIVTFDSLDDWTVLGAIVCGAQGDAHDVENVGAHDLVM